MNLAKRELQTFYKFGIAFLAVMSVVVITLTIPALGDGGMYFLFLTAVIFSTLRGDWRSGAFAAVLSLVVNFFLLRYLGKSPNGLGDWMVLFAFGLAAVFTIFICHAQIKSEIARRLAESRYRIIFEDAITGIYETTLDGRYAAANPKLSEIFGYDSPAEMIRNADNLNDKFYVEPNRREEFARLVEKHGSIAGFESEIYQRSGAKIWITENSVAVRDPHGELIGFQGTTIEITDRKRAVDALEKAREELEEKVAARTADLESANKVLREEIIERVRVENALRESEEKFRSLVEVSSEMIWEVDENTNYTYVSPKNKEFNGYEPHEVLGNKPFLFMPPDEARRVAKIFKRLGENKETFYFLETITVDKKGELSISETSGVPFFDDAGNFRGYRGVARNITERKRAADALRQSEEKFRNLVEATTDWIWEADANGVYTYASPKIKDLSGFEPEEIIGKSVYSLMPPDEAERVKRIVREMTAAGKGLTILESVQIHKNGEPLTTETSSVLFYDENGKLIGSRGIARDITERKRIENELLTSQKQLRALSAHLQLVREEERKNLARELHDEFGQQLTALKIDLVRFGEKPLGANKTLSSEFKNKIPAMLKIVDMAMDTIRKIVAELRPGVLDELGLAAAMEWQTSEFQKRTGIICALEIEFDENAVCQSLKTTVFRILQECLTNIARHSGANHAQITLRDEGWRIFFEVEDDGRGIVIGETGEPQSFGILGMRERALLLGGTVEISRAEPNGTRIAVLFPRPAQMDSGG